MVLRWLLALLVVATLLGLFANARWMTRRLALDGRGPGQGLQLIDDRGSGGASRAELVEGAAGGPIAMRCEIRRGFEWPFCELQIEMLGHDLNLGAFSHIRLWLHAEGPTLDGGPAQVRVFLRNFDPAYSAKGGAIDLKPHEVVLAPGAQPVPVELRLSQFMVSSWWAQSHPLPVPLMGPQLDRVRVFSLSTGGQVAPGLHLIRLERAELVGNWVAPETFRLGLVGLWMFSLLAYLAWEAWAMRGRLRHSMRRSRMLEQMALRDPLTRIANRDGLNRALDLLMQVQGDMAFPLSVVFVDADHFKRINDEHGHEVGDQVLTLLAQTLRANLPRDDLLARWGGEEFVIVMPQTPVEEAVAVAERLRQVLARTEWPAGLKVSASWGVAQASALGELDRALHEADQAMYRAKQGGRDRVISA
ncbi:GGDEF domain-containing protein [Roseateles saccharophilus]|uniref:diguanylate cyclase n=1 Tax=Roseateles saccharophilus TaxID=304 RepID=A0A4R3V0Z1_ROSSA|nr:GGDEF domain-containing protein [Roseateles saccharophilus]MDG0832396.1 GGDEF domain-containing protein [Roseateles saccharophilus]TCU97091.1 diguanylate cyclase (GGDEF)-like protein [Roseateles saccharophilus]